jgi:prepilin-type N-terminal cleavage/methylation domain-containing protein
MNKPQSHGFTLVEIAIVLVVIGLLIGGVLRGQELMNSARASTIVTQQSSMQTAYFGFVDRYKMLPGDLDGVQALLINNSTAPASSSGDGNVLLDDSPAFFNNLAQAGFIACEPCSSPSVITVGTGGAPATYIPPTTGLNARNSPVNAYGQPLSFYFNTGATAGSTPVAGGSTAGSVNFLGIVGEGGKPLMLTGGVIPSPILSEIDRKKDDGAPGGGGFRYTDIVGTTGTSGASIFVSTATSNSCFTGTGVPYIWVVNTAGNCQGASLL